MKIKVHPLFFALIFYFIISMQFQLIACYLVAIIAHEIAHAQVAKLRGYEMGTITLMPFGGVLEGGNGFNPNDNLIIALAGPLFNAIFAIICVAVWWVFPSIYNYTLELCIANIAMCLVNIMPLYPLDGSRVVISLVKEKKLKAIKILKLTTIIVGACLSIFGVVLVCIKKANISLIIFGIFLVYNAFVKSNEESYLHISKNNFLDKSYVYGLKKSSIYVSKDTQLFRLLGYINPVEYCEFFVVEKGVIINTFNETKLGELCIDNELSDTLQEVLGL